MEEKDKINLENNKNIPDEEVLMDIRDTQREIVELEVKNRDNIKKIAYRHAFIDKLNYLLELRKLIRSE